MTGRGTVMRDPVHGDISLTAEEVRLLDTATFQRLRGIKQLGTAHLVYPGATHTRFEHAIGTVHMVDRLLSAAGAHAVADPATCMAPDPEARRILRIAALLHDVTHIPFGHNIEDQTGLLPRHDRPERFQALLGDTDLGERLAEMGLRDQVLQVLTGSDEVPAYWRQALSDTVDGDLLDYLKRDAHYTGLELRYDPRVVGYFRIGRAAQRMYVDCGKDGMLREDTTSELIRLLDTRYFFSERVYYHHAKVAAGALIARAAEPLLACGAVGLTDLQSATDESLLLQLAAADPGDGATRARVQRFLERFRRRELPKRIAVLPQYENAGIQAELLQRFHAPANAATRLELEQRWEREAEQHFGRPVDMILYCPAGAMQLKEARTLVRMPGVGGGDPVAPMSKFVERLPRLRDLAASYPRLWKLYVLTSERDREARRWLQQMVMRDLPDKAVNTYRL